MDATEKPSRTYRLYDEGLPAAGHLGEPPQVSDADVRIFASDVRGALGEYLRIRTRLHSPEATPGALSVRRPRTAVAVCRR
jgi:hypothetical protein